VTELAGVDGMRRGIHGRVGCWSILSHFVPFLTTTASNGQYKISIFF
jgi:hypothetical protein